MKLVASRLSELIPAVTNRLVVLHLHGLNGIPSGHLICVDRPRLVKFGLRHNLSLAWIQAAKTIGGLKIWHLDLYGEPLTRIKELLEELE